MRIEIPDDLNSPHKTLRISVFEKLFREGNSEEQLQALIVREKKEEDEECKTLLRHAIRAIQTRLEPEKSRESTAYDSEAFLKQYSEASDDTRIQLLSNFPPSLALEMSKNAPKLLALESNPFVISALLWAFIEHWPNVHLTEVSRLLSSDSVRVRCAALELLIKQAPETLEIELPKLLATPDPRLRNLAIRGLLEIDREEAVAYLDDLLMSHQPSLKIAGLQNCFYFPFDLVKPLIYKFFAAESDPELLERGGVFLITNVDIEAPFRLWAIAENSDAHKANKIREIMKGVFQIIENSNILGENLNIYIEKFQSWIYAKKAKSFVKKSIEMLVEAKGVLNPKIEAVISAGLNHSGVNSAFRAALDTDIPEKVKAAINKILDAAQYGSDVQEKPPERQDQMIWEDLPIDEKIRQITLWQSEDSEKPKKIVEKIILDDSSPADLRATSLRSAVRYAMDNFSEKSLELLENPDANLATAALEYLGHFYPERVLSQFEKYFQGGDIFFKIAAFRVLKRFDVPRAVSILKRELYDKSKERRMTAFTCMLYIDFSLVREMITTFLESNADPQVLDSCLDLFLANPLQENLYPLVRLEKLLKPEFSEKVRNVRLQSEKLLEQLGLSRPQQKQIIQDDCEQRWKTEREKMKAPLPAYSFKIIRKVSS